MILQDTVRITTTTSHALDTLTKRNIVPGKYNVFESYFYHLSKDPERIDALLMWLVTVAVAWFVLFKFRKEIVRGLEGANLFFEGGEIVTFLSLWLFPPIAARIAFFKESSGTQLYCFYAFGIIMLYQLTGRYIFDWALALKGGLSSVPPAPEKAATPPSVQINVDQSPPK